jgi:signal transduction histidine kinase
VNGGYNILARDSILEEYEERIKAQTDFFTNVSHELKTPLSIILIQFELMRLYRDDTEKMDELIAMAEQNSYRLTRLVNNLLDISKIDSGFMQPNLVNADIVALVGNLCDTVKDFAEAKLIKLRLQTKVSSQIMLADIDKIERIILNLLSNAIKHTLEGGYITVGIEKNGEKIVISVSDTGEGIPRDKLEVIFDRYAQVDTSLTRKNEGTGIGLSLTKSFVELLGGRIWADSSFGKGSTFYVELPILHSSDRLPAEQGRRMDLSRNVELELSDLAISEMGKGNGDTP